MWVGLLKVKSVKIHKCKHTIYVFYLDRATSHVMYLLRFSCPCNSRQTVKVITFVHAHTDTQAGFKDYDTVSLTVQSSESGTQQIQVSYIED